MAQDFWTDNGLDGEGVSVGITDPGQTPPDVTAQPSSSSSSNKFAGMDEQQAFMQAVSDLGLSGNDLRGHLDKITNYLNANGSSGWQNGGTQADDWIQTPSGQQKDVLLSGSNQVVWNPDSSGGGSTGGQSGPYNPSDYGVPSNPYAPPPLNIDFGNLPGVPDNLKTPLNLPTWNQSFNAPVKPDALNTPYALPTLDQLQSSPGYQARLDANQQAQQRSAASRGTILSGGFQNALGKSQQDYASNEYNNLAGQTLAARQENVGEYQGDFTNAFNQYTQKYGEFNNANQTALAQRGQNESEYLNNTLNPAIQTQQNQYQQALANNAQNLQAYLTNAGLNRQGIQDFLNQGNTTANRGLQAVIAGRPS